MTDPYEDQLAAARYRAERDQARQELARLGAERDRARQELVASREYAHDMEDENEYLRDMLNDVAWKLGIGREVHYLRGYNYAKCHKRVLDEISKLTGPTSYDVAQVTTSAYDLLPEEDREALRWVRGHGGLDSVRKLLDWVVGHCSTKQQLDFDFWLSGRVMYELGFDEDMADRDEVDRRLLARLMPEGMEWPRYDTGEPLKLDDEVAVKNCEPVTVRFISFEKNGFSVRHTGGCRVHWFAYGERVKRPAPKVLDADGIRIEPGMDVWWVCEGDERGIHAEKLHVESIGEDGLVTCDPFNSGAWVELEPSELYVNRPVLDADGEPIRKGDTVYANGSGYGDGTAWRVVRIEPAISHPLCCKREDGNPGGARNLKPEWVTHRAPFLAVDDKPLLKGETVWSVDSGTRYTVEEIKDGLIPIKCRSEMGSTVSLHPSQLTHERPDSWERLEEDAEKDPCGYFGFDGEETCGKCPASGKNCEQTMARDLVRRAKKLAGVSE